MGPLEYHNKTITRIFGGNTRYGCYFLALLIFTFGLFRDHLCVLEKFMSQSKSNQTSSLNSYQQALRDQPRQKLLPAPYDTLVPAVLFGVGQTFVITSTWALGVTGTFLGDYFGILMDHRVEGFPFNVLRDPMYVGSTMCFAATALWYVTSSAACITLLMPTPRTYRYERPAGLLITAYVYAVYLIALRFEG